MSELLAQVSGLGLAGILLTWFLATALAAYIGTRFTNLATRQDLGKLTDIAAAIRSQYAHQLEAAKAIHQLRLAAIDKRLAAHQEAFTKWIEMFREVHQPGLLDKVKECRTWWDHNCVYLEPKVRDTFLSALNAASFHKTILDARRDTTDPKEREEIKKDLKENWAKITGFADIVFEAVQFPNLTVPSLKEIAPDLKPEGKSDAPA